MPAEVVHVERKLLTEETRGGKLKGGIEVGPDNPE
jgi:hypothetical protein